MLNYAPQRFLSRSCPIICLLLALVCADASAQQTALRSALAERITEAPLEHAHFGVIVVNLENGSTLFARNAEKHFVPASNVKLYTTAAVLDQLGPQYRYETTLYARGEIDGRLLRGDLIVRGSGDPTFSGEFHGDSIAYVLDTWSDSLKAHRIYNIAGDLIGDDDFFSDVPLGRGWSWDDIPSRYTAEIGGLNYHDNIFELTISTHAPGTPATLSLEPSLPAFAQFVSTLETRERSSESDLSVDRQFTSNVFELSGHLPAYSTVDTWLAIHDPTSYFLHAFDWQLRENSISLHGELLDIDAAARPPDYTSPSVRRIAAYQSPPMREIVKEVNKASQNLYAEILLRTLGAERPVPESRLENEDAEPGSAAMGSAAAMRTYAAAGIDTSRIVLVDGSGLSRYNLVSPTMTAKLLSYMWHHLEPEVQEAYYQSLAVAGVDGTLEYRMQAASTRGNVRGKTGTLWHVSALSGYIESAAGTPMAFAMMSNHHTLDSDVVERVMDSLAEIMAFYPQ